MKEIDPVRRRVRGVTLIELMVVVVVLAIVASIAVPSYRSYVLRTQRTDATAALLRAQSAQEKFFLQNNRYMTDAEFAALGLDNSEHGYYGIDRADGAGPLQFIITATPVPGGPQASDTKCTSFTLNELGQRGSGPSPIETCWK